MMRLSGTLIAYGAGIQPQQIQSPEYETPSCSKRLNRERERERESIITRESKQTESVKLDGTSEVKAFVPEINDCVTIRHGKQ
jgi:hypothetical protein